MADLFKEIIPSILVNKKSVINDPSDLKDYKSFIVNRALSYHLDCIPYVSALNICPNLDPDMEYMYLLNSIRPMKRKFQPWQRAAIDKDIECIKIAFGYSNEKAKAALNVLTPEQLAHIKEKTNKGGVVK